MKNILKTYDQKIGKLKRNRQVNFENSRITSRLHTKMRSGKSAIIILCIITILCSFSIFDFTNSKENDLDDNLRAKREKRKNFLLFCSSFCAISLSALEMVSKYYELQYNLYRGNDKKDNRFFSYRNLKPVLTNIIFYLIHPNYVVENYNFFGANNRISFSYRNEISLNYTLNDILLVLNVLNVIPLFNSLLRYISYNSDTADRVCRINGFNKGLMFGLKSLFKKRPITLLLSIFMALMCVFAIVLRICEF